MIVKICGVRSIEQAKMVLRAGADWIGLNLVGGPRQIDLQTAETILSSLAEPDQAVVLWELVAPDGTSVGQETPDALERLRSLGVRRLQIYGVPCAADLRRLSDRGFETILVRHVTDERSIAECDAFVKACGTARPAYVLLDAKADGQLGGTGRRVDWEMLRRCRESGQFADWPPILLAGGLTPENVGGAIEAVRPFGVDVSSGIESAPGIKDEAAVLAFVRASDQHRGPSSGDTVKPRNDD